jgi:hypothetical protein
MYLDEAKAAYERTHLAVNEVLNQFDDEHVIYPSGNKPEVIVCGCTEAEVAALEQRIGSALPAAYREFLLWMGHSGEHLLRGSDVFYDRLIDLQEWGPELLEENSIPPMPDDAFVFYMHQGYQLAFFRLSEGDNPPAYYYGEGEGLDRFRLDYARYSDFLVAVIESLAVTAAGIRQLREHRRK